MPKITVDEWLDEISRLSAQSDEGYTVREWCERVKKSDKWVQPMLKKAKSLGWLVVGKRTMESLDGKRYPATVYRIVRPKK